MEKNQKKMYTIIPNDSKSILKKNYQSLTLEVDEEKQAKRDKEYKSLRNILLILILVLLNYYLLSNVIIINFRNSYFKTNGYWKDIENSTESKNCQQSSSFNKSTLMQLNSFISYLNQKEDFNYFMCFSSLYYTVKVQGYDIFKSHLQQESFQNKNLFYNLKNKNKCVQKEYMDNSGFSQKPISKIHLCYLNSYLREDSLCAVAKVFESEYQVDLNCKYNYFTGEYSISLNNEIQILFHEYELDFKLFSYFYDSVLASNETFEKNNKKYFENSAQLNSGLLSWVFEVQYFDIPRNFFYSNFETSKHDANFLNYLDTPFRLPSEIVNYFMIFYSKIWYL